jgi:methylmalonyl-CoA mutase
LRLEAGPHGQRAAEAIAAHIDSQPVDPERLTLEFGMDPLGVLAARGDLDEVWPDTAERVHATVNALRARHFVGPFMMADGRVWHEGGATAAQELGLVLATATTYLRALEALPEEALARSVAVTLAADQDMFLTLAKFRAMRLLWARILEAAQLPPAPLRLHGETSWRMMTAKDPHTNILRAAAGVFGAALGGADSIVVMPFSLAQGLPDAFARRVARNSQNILSMESNLWRVADPAGSAGYVEHLTGELCNHAWDEFQAIERAGGLVEALRTGIVQKTLAEERRRAAALVAEGEQAILGVTDFKAHAEPSPAIEPATPSMPRPRIGAAILVEPIPSLRLSEAFESEAEVRAIA